MGNLRPVTALCAAVALGVSLQGADAAECRGPEHASPDGRCVAYYYTATYSQDSATTQALFLCELAGKGQGGGNLHSFPPGAVGGVGIEWLDDTTLQLHVPADQVELRHKVSHPSQVQFWQRKINIVRVPIAEDHPDFRGCLR